VRRPQEDVHPRGSLTAGQPVVPSRPDPRARHWHVEPEAVAKARMRAVGGDDERCTDDAAVDEHAGDAAVLDERSVDGHALMRGQARSAAVALEQAALEYQ